MTPSQYLRLGIYGTATLAAAVAAVVAAVHQNGPMLTLALGWIATNVIAIPNTGRTTEPTGDHAAL